MTNRRKFITGVVTAGTVAVAGCNQSVGDITSSEPTIEENELLLSLNIGNRTNQNISVEIGDEEEYIEKVDETSFIMDFSNANVNVPIKYGSVFTLTSDSSMENLSISITEDIDRISFSNNYNRLESEQSEESVDGSSEPKPEESLQIDLTIDMPIQIPEYGYEEEVTITIEEN